MRVVICRYHTKRNKKNVKKMFYSFEAQGWGLNKITNSDSDQTLRLTKIRFKNQLGCWKGSGSGSGLYGLIQGCGSRSGRIRVFGSDPGFFRFPIFFLEGRIRIQVKPTRFRDPAGTTVLPNSGTGEYLLRIASMRSHHGQVPRVCVGTEGK